MFDAFCLAQPGSANICIQEVKNAISEIETQSLMQSMRRMTSAIGTKTCLEARYLETNIVPIVLKVKRNLVTIVFSSLVGDFETCCSSVI